MKWKGELSYQDRWGGGQERETEREREGERDESKQGWRNPVSFVLITYTIETEADS